MELHLNTKQIVFIETSEKNDSDVPQGNFRKICSIIVYIQSRQIVKDIKLKNGLIFLCYHLRRKSTGLSQQGNGDSNIMH